MWTPQRREVVALVALLDLATTGDARSWVKTQHVAERHDIPLAFLEQITHRLCQAGLVTSRRGPAGGLRLARAAAAIRLGDVLRAVRGAEAPAEPAAPRSLEQLVLARLGQAGLELERALDAITLEQLLEHAERLNLAARRKSALSFDI